MRGSLALQIGLLGATSAGAVWVAILSFGRRHVPGGRALGGLSLAIAWWSLFSALHSLPQPLETQILLTKFQKAGIFAVPPCWLLFTSEYMRAGWTRHASRRRMPFLVPVLFVIAIAFNETHGLYYTGVERVNGATVYRWGPLFWLGTAYNYALMLAGTVVLLRGLRLFPRPYRSQTISLAVAALVPWVGNAAYLSGALRPGFDPTPLLFGLSSVLFFAGMFALRLFDVVPLARAAVFEGLTDGVLVLDRAHRIVDANRAALNVIGAPGEPAALDRAIGRHPSELLPWWDALASSPAPDDAEPALVTVGERLLELHAATFVDGRGGSLLWMRDVTARRKAEFERVALERKLREQERIESLTVMAAGLSHDFNNLLTAILGNADYLVATSPHESERKASAEAITVAAQHAADLISQIVAFSGGGRTVIAPVSLEDAVGDVLRAFTRTLGERAMITHESHADLPVLSGDLVQIRQAVLALLANAVTAVEATHGSVEVLTGRETLDAQALAGMNYSAALGPGDFVFVDVKDDGPGIPADVLPRIFEPFYSTHSIGRGLGLAAVHGILRGHDGAIRITTAPGEGTSVRLWFPLG